MSLVDDARKALVEIPLSEVVRERLSLALDQLAEVTRKNDELRAENGGVKALLQREHTEHNDAKKELQELRDAHAEDVRISQAIEFRRGKRTGGKWLAFCPKCSMPAVQDHDRSVVECSAGCGWIVPLRMDVNALAQGL